jgi:hypothetical protein
MNVKIYKPSKSTMQSGRGKTEQWVLEYELLTARNPEALMGWASAGDTMNQVRLKFDTCLEAENFARAKGWNFTTLPEQKRVVTPRNYVDNFKYTPPESRDSV